MAEQLNWEKKDSLEDVKIILAKILRRWHWVVLGLLLGSGAAYLYIRYQDSEYMVTSSFISRKFDDRGVSVVPMIGEEGFANRIEVNQQIPLLKSENRIYETLDRLEFRVSYFVEGRLKTTELYKTNPFKVTFNDSSKYIPYNIPIFLEKVDHSSFRLSTLQESLNTKFINQTFLFNTIQNINGWEFNIRHANGNGLNPDYKYYFIIHNPRTLMNTYRGKLDIAWAYRESAILNSSIETKTPEKDYDFLKTYLQVVIDFGLEEKRRYLVNSINFIDRYMVEITDTLLQYQDKMDEYRMTNRDVISGSTLVIDKLRGLEDKRTDLMLESNYYSYLEEYIKKQKTEEVFAPNLIGLDVPPLQDLINNYMTEKWGDQVSKNEFNEKNPLVTKDNEEFERMELNIYESVKNLKALNDEKISQMDKQIDFYLRSIDDLQVGYRKYVNLERLKAIYEELYTRLLTRKTDASISMASVTSDYEIVSEPYFSPEPIFPNEEKIFLISIVLGLGLPIGFILLIDFLNPKVISKEDLKKNTSIPVIGTVGHFKGVADMVVHDSPKSQVSESFRVIRANLEYLDLNRKEARVILITSSISGEGKTFCSTNLAYTYSNTSKKTLLIGADMRRPALARNFGMKKEQGLSNYLSGQCEVEDIIYKTNSTNLYVIPSGHVPPNPSELLGSEQMTQLMEFVRTNFEVIIIDTPPIGLVSDTMELIRFSYTPIMIVRQNTTFKKSLAAITEMYDAGKFKNLGIIMNDINYSKYDYGAYYGQNYGYGSGQGYGYYEDEDKKGFWKRLFHS